MTKKYTEAEMQSNELKRIENEEIRIENEAERVANEIERIANEEIRNEFYEGFNDRLDGIDSQLAHNMNEISHLKNIKTLATEIGMVDNDPTKAEQNYNIINNFLNGSHSRILFLNGERFYISQKLVITQKNTQLLGNSRGKSLNVSCLVGDFNDTVLEINIPAGANGSIIQGISIDGCGVATCGINIVDNNFYDSCLEKIFIDNINGTGLRIGENCYSSKYYEICTGWNVKIGLELASADNQQSVFRDCHFYSIETGGMIGTTKNSLRVVTFSNCDFTSKQDSPLKIYSTSYSVVFSNCWIEYQGTSTINNLISLGSEDLRCEGVVFRDGIYQCNDKTNFVFHILNADLFEISGSCCFTSFLKKIFTIENAKALNGRNVFSCNLPVAQDCIEETKIGKVFVYFRGSNTASEPFNQTPFFFNADSALASGGNAMIVNSKRKSESQPRLIIDESSITFGDGSNSPDVGFVRSGENLLSMINGDSFKVEGKWNGGKLILGYYRLWVDSSGNLRIKNGEPDSDTDGIIVGSQS